MKYVVLVQYETTLMVLKFEGCDSKRFPVRIFRLLILTFHISTVSY